MTEAVEIDISMVKKKLKEMQGKWQGNDLADTGSHGKPSANIDTARCLYALNASHTFFPFICSELAGQTHRRHRVCCFCHNFV